MPTIHAIHTILTIDTKHTILSKHSIPDRPYTPYIPNTILHPHHTTGGEGDSTTPPPHHRGGGGQCHTPTTPQGGEGEDLIWRQYMGPIPLGGEGVAGPGAYIHICDYVISTISYNISI